MVPFATEDWPAGPMRKAACALWSWHTAVRRAEGGLQTAIPDEIGREALLVCQRHNLPRVLLDKQLEAALSVKHNTAFETTTELADYINATAGSHAVLLARLAGERGQWIEQPVYAFARAIFLTRSLCNLKKDLAASRLYLPQDAVNQAGVTRQQLAEGRLNAPVRRLLWKQVIRARDAYANSRTLTQDLSGWPRRTYRRYWTGGLYILGLIEARRFDVWSKPVRLSAFGRAQVYWQTYFGKK